MSCRCASAQDFGINLSDPTWHPQDFTIAGGFSRSYVEHLMTLKQRYGLKVLRPMEFLGTNYPDPAVDREQRWMWIARLVKALDLQLWLNVHPRESKIPEMVRAFRDVPNKIVEYGNEPWNGRFTLFQDLTRTAAHHGLHTPFDNLQAEYLVRAIEMGNRFDEPRFHNSRLALNYQFWAEGHWQLGQALQGVYGKFPTDALITIAPYLGTPIGRVEQHSVDSILQQLVGHFGLLKTQLAHLKVLAAGRDIAAYELNHHMAPQFWADEAKQVTQAALIERVLDHPAMPTIYRRLYEVVGEVCDPVCWFRGETGESWNGAGNKSQPGYYGNWRFSEAVARGLLEAVSSRQ